VPQATRTSNPYSVAISGVKTNSGDFQRPAMGGVGGVNSQQVQQQNTYGRPSVAPPYQPAPCHGLGYFWILKAMSWPRIFWD
jgi:hypothetical protein